MIIEIVGIDGAGKSTLAAALAGRLVGVARKTNAFPGDTHVQASAVAARLGERAEVAFRASAIAVALLAEAASPAPNIVVYDRFLEGARMYFSVVTCWPLPEDVLAAVPAPDMVILIDVDVETGLSRRARPAAADPSSERSYMRACANYLRRRASTEGWTVLNGEDAPGVVLDRAEAAVRGAHRRL